MTERRSTGLLPPISNTEAPSCGRRVLNDRVASLHRMDASPSLVFEEERSRQRHGRIVGAALAAAFARSTSLIALAVSVPLVLGEVGRERFGLWAMLASLTALLTFADLGLGSGLVTAVAQAQGRGDVVFVRQAISSAFFILTLVALATGCVFALLYPTVAWERVFNVSSDEAVREAGPAVGVFVACFLLNLPLSLSHRIQLGLQESFRSSLWIAAGNCIGLCALVCATYVDASLEWLVLATLSGPLLAAAGNSMSLFGFEKRWLRPALKVARLSVGWPLMRTGFLFLAVQIALAVAYESDALVVAHVLGPEAVADYMAPLKMFLLAPLLVSLGLVPLWPAYAEALVCGDRTWVVRTFVRSLSVTSWVAGPIVLILVMFGDRVVQLWTSGEVDPSVGLRIALGAWALTASVGGVASMLLNGAGEMRFQAACAAAMALLNLPLSIALATAFGLSGPALASVIATIVVVQIPAAFRIRRVLAGRTDAPARDRTRHRFGSALQPARGD